MNRLPLGKRHFYSVLFHIYWKTLLIYSIALYFSTKSGGIYLFSWLLIISLLYLLTSLMIKIIKKRPTLIINIKLIGWLITCGSAIFFQNQLAKEYKINADLLCQEIEEFNQQNKRFPTPSEVDIKFTWQKIIYYKPSEDKEPYLFYRDPITLFDSFYYDFKNKQWNRS